MLTPIPGQVDLSLDLGGQLLDLAKGLGLDFGFERSFRLARSELQSDRLRLTVDANQLNQHISPVSLLRWLRFPSTLTVDAMSLLRASTQIQFGVEENARTPILKLYFEQTAGHLPHRTPVHWTTPSMGRASRVRRLACEWFPMSPERWVATTYAEPSSDESIRDQIQFRLGKRAAPVSDFVNDLLDIAASRSLAHCCYAEVCEVGSPRQSFDLSLHTTQIRISEIMRPLDRLAQQFELPTQAEHWIATIAQEETVGRIAAGTHRNRQPFVTVYHSVTNDRCI